MKQLIFISYAWGTTILYALLIMWLASIPNLGTGDTSTQEAINVFYRIVLYSIFVILFYRSIIVTLKTTVSRLSKWRSKNEKHEDAEFVLLIETLVIVITVLATTLFAVIEEVIQRNVEGRTSEVRDVLISVLSIMLTSLVIYSAPIVGEIEMVIREKWMDGLNIGKSTKKGAKKRKK